MRPSQIDQLEKEVLKDLLSQGHPRSMLDLDSIADDATSTAVLTSERNGKLRSYKEARPKALKMGRAMLVRLKVVEFLEHKLTTTDIDIELIATVVTAEAASQIREKDENLPYDEVLPLAICIANRRVIDSFRKKELHRRKEFDISKTKDKVVRSPLEEAELKDEVRHIRQILERLLAMAGHRKTNPLRSRYITVLLDRTSKDAPMSALKPSSIGREIRKHEVACGKIKPETAATSGCRIWSAILRELVSILGKEDFHG